MLDVNCTLVLGTERALLVDTLSTTDQATELAAAVRSVTTLPVTVVNTHDHFDHTFGNAVIADVLGVDDFWAHPTVIATLLDRPDELRAGARRACARLAPSIADAVGHVELRAPNRPVEATVELDLGGRQVTVWHPGPAHSDGDLVVIAGDVLIAGDLIEEGAPPNTVGSDLANWPLVIDALLPHMAGPVIPGHGAVVDVAFARRQRDEIAAMAA